MISCLLATLLIVGAGYVIAMNWIWTIQNVRNRRRGIQRHYSTMPLVAQVLLVIAVLLSGREQSFWLPPFVFWAIGLADVSLWMLFSFFISQLNRSNLRSGRGDAKAKEKN